MYQVTIRDEPEHRQTIIRGGEVIDPCQGIHGRFDIAVANGRITAVAPQIEDLAGAEVIEAAGRVVVPGLIDMHTHVAEAIIPLGASTEQAGVNRGVTTLCDAGSTGYSNFPGFRKYVIAPSQTDVFCYLHIAPTGLAVMPEIRGWEDVSEDETVATARANRDVIKGIKFRAVMPGVTTLGTALAQRAKQIAVAAGLPLMVHIGDGLCGDQGAAVEAFTREMVHLMDRGDIIAHIYAPAPGGMIKPDGTVHPELTEAIRRGVLLDSAHGRPNMSFAVARAGIGLGILPHIISTDLAATNADGPIYSLTLTMSKFLALGLTLDQVIAMTTVNPARALDEAARRGTLGVGAPADITVLRLVPGDYTFVDGSIGNKIPGDTLILPELTLKNGTVIAPRPGAEVEIS